jgi:drug/metabolite transporter (DMT)-like permease
MASLVRVASHRGFGTWEIVTWRMAIGAIGCLPFLSREGQSARVRRRGLLLLRILVGATAVLTYFWSIALLPVGLATLFNYLGPVFTALFAARFLGERVGRTFAVGLALALCGVGLTLPGLHGGGALGAAVGLLSAVLQGGAVTFIRELRRTEGAVTIFFWFAAATTVLCLPLAIAELHRPNGIDLLVLLGVGLSSLGAQLLLTEALGHAPASTAAMLAPITPLTGFVIGAVALAEPLTLRIAVGAAVALAGVAIGMRGAPPVSPALPD